MPDYQFTFTVQGISSQRATAIRDRMVQRLGDDAVTVASMSMAQTTSSFRVVSVDMGTKQVFDETIEATDRQAARDSVASATRVVATVNGGSA